MEPLLETKLHIPRWRSSLVSRPRLIERLNQESERKLTLVSAPAGFGKSTLLADWLTTSPENCTLQAIRTMPIRTMPTGAKGARMDAKPQLSPLRKVSGIAALVEAATFVVGFALFFTLIADADYGSLDIDPVENAEFLADNQAIMYVWNLIIYVVFGIVLVVLALALHEQLKVTSPALMQTATVFGFIWAGLVIASGMVANIGAAVVVEIYDTDPVQAATVWLSFSLSSMDLVAEMRLSVAYGCSW